MSGNSFYINMVLYINVDHICYETQSNIYIYIFVMVSYRYT